MKTMLKYIRLSVPLPLESDWEPLIVVASLVEENQTQTGLPWVVQGIEISQTHSLQPLGVELAVWLL